MNKKKLSLYGLVMLAMVIVISACSTSGTSRLADFPLSKEPLIGKFIWHDLVTDDVDQVKQFYGSLLGWTFKGTTHPNGGDYTLIMMDDRYVGGIVQLDDPVGAEYSRWLGYLSVSDVDRAVEFTRSEGGTTAVGPVDLPGIGRAAAIVDPQSTVVGLIRSNLGDMDDSLQPGPGLIVWNEMLASDDTAAAAFYATLGEYQVQGEGRKGGVYHVLTSQGQKRAAVMQRPEDNIQPFWLTHFGVEDVNDAARRVTELGGTVILAPDAEFRNGQLALVTDPSGAILALKQWAE